jgi:hypothetical protein
VCLAAHIGEDSWRRHARFGHANFTSLKKMATAGMVRGLPQLEQVDQLCEACLAGKHKRTSFLQGVQLSHLKWFMVIYVARLPLLHIEVASSFCS